MHNVLMIFGYSFYCWSVEDGRTLVQYVLVNITNGREVAWGLSEAERFKQSRLLREKRSSWKDAA